MVTCASRAVVSSESLWWSRQPRYQSTDEAACGSVAA